DHNDFFIAVDVLAFGFEPLTDQDLGYRFADFRDFKFNGHKKDPRTPSPSRARVQSSTCHHPTVPHIWSVLSVGCCLFPPTCCVALVDYFTSRASVTSLSCSSLCTRAEPVAG